MSHNPANSAVAREILMESGLMLTTINTVIEALESAGILETSPADALPSTISFAVGDNHYIHVTPSGSIIDQQPGVISMYQPYETETIERLKKRTDALDKALRLGARRYEKMQHLGLDFDFDQESADYADAVNVQNKTQSSTIGGVSPAEDMASTLRYTMDKTYKEQIDAAEARIATEEEEA